MLAFDQAAAANDNERLILGTFLPDDLKQIVRGYVFQIKEVGYYDENGLFKNNASVHYCVSMVGFSPTERQWVLRHYNYQNGEIEFVPETIQKFDSRDGALCIMKQIDRCTLRDTISGSSLFEELGEIRDIKVIQGPDTIKDHYSLLQEELSLR